jgi:hypothetical protein
VFNRVLEFDDKGSYLAIPPDLITNLQEAAVEGWVKRPLRWKAWAPQCLMKGGAENSSKPLIQIKHGNQVKSI